MAFDILAVVAQLSGALLWPLLQVIIMMVMGMVWVIMMVNRVMVMVIQYDAIFRFCCQALHHLQWWNTQDPGQSLSG